MQVVEENPDQPTIPTLVYMSFKRKGGNPVLFGQFMRQIKEEMAKFMEPAEEVPAEEVE